jgi:hypothetical protein
VLVYREGKREVRTAELLDDLIRSLRDVADARSHHSEHLLNALLRAGAMECALSDAAPASSRVSSADADGLFSELTNTLADNLLSAGEDQPASCGRAGDLNRLFSQIQLQHLPEKVSISAPEGFAYYALDPLAYAAATESIEIGGRPVFVIGLRTIGATLSAVMAAAARRRGGPVERITVRPSGHPFDRRTDFNAEQRRRIVDAASQRALFFIVDEGPGLSGSSLVSVADALSGIGVPRCDVAVFCAHAPDPSLLRSRHAAECWPELRIVTAGQTLQPPPDAAIDWSGGLWRRDLYRDPAQWPAVWPHVERLKFVSRDGARLFKFEGLGPYGEKPLERARAAAEAGWSPALDSADSGFAAYARVDGTPMNHRDLDAAMIDRLARYCDFRQREMRAESQGPHALAELARVNVWEEFGVECEPGIVEIARPVIADARMMPHEWLRDHSGRIWKTDVASHGDDHFYPGATDIAWDLAGAIVEWRMDRSAAEALVERYGALSGDDASRRLSWFVTAYSAFRLGFCRMAAESCAEERERMTRQADDYAALLRPPREQAGAEAHLASRSGSPA